MTFTLLVKQAHFLQKEIKDSERTDSIEHMLIMNSAVTQLALQVELMFYELGD
jgi:hypothetical protein